MMKIIGGSEYTAKGSIWGVKNRLMAELKAKIEKLKTRET
jgi:hypothetical protein